MMDWPDEHHTKLPPPYQKTSTSTASTSTTTTDQTLPSTSSSNVEKDEITLLTENLLNQFNKSPSKTYSLLKHAFTLDEQNKKAGYKAAEKWYQHTNDSVSQVWMAKCMMEGWGTQADIQLGFTQLKNMADHGTWEAYYFLASCYLNGIYTNDQILIQESNKQLAYQWFLACSRIEIPTSTVTSIQDTPYEFISLSQYRLATMLFHGIGVAENHPLAFEWFEKSASFGNRYAQFIIGYHYEKGIHIQQDITRAIHYYQSSANQDFVDAQAALGICLIEQNQFDQGIPWLQKAIEKNNARALLKYGIMHETGKGVSKDSHIALHYYKLAVHQDDPVAHYILGLHYRLDTSLPNHHVEAGKHFHRSAKAGFPPSQRLLGLMYAQGLLSTNHDELTATQRRRKDEKQALIWFKRAASHGDVRALGLVGSCYEHGHGAAVNFDVALQYYQKAARISSPFQCSAQVAVANLLHKMNRHRDAFDWFLRASSLTLTTSTSEEEDEEEDVTYLALDREQRKAKLMVARYRLHGWSGVDVNPELGFTMLCELTLNNTTDGHAHYWLAACYEEGVPQVCTSNLSKAFEHYQVAALAGDMDAQFQVAFMLSNGKGVEKNRQQAFQWYEKSAQKGHKTALYSLGLYYAKGLDGIPKDLNKARDCFEKSAQLGFVTSMTSLASLYRLMLTSQQQHQQQMNSNDLLDNPTYYRDQMIFWYRKAASFGEITAQRELGTIYNGGLFGISQDHNLALEFLRKANQQQDAQATLLLGSYYQHGIIVEKDQHQAIQLYLNAASYGSSIAHFAAAQVYHTLHQYELAFQQYQISYKDHQLKKNRIGKTSKLMVARYVLSYIASSPSTPSTPPSSIHYTKQEAFEMLNELATQDHFEPSFYWLADCYFNGFGTNVNTKEALYWYRQSADKTQDKDAMFKVAHMYENGIDVDVDLSIAFRYIQKSAELGHIEAQHQMGMAYWRGSYNTDIDLNLAIQWFTKSATQRYKESHWALGQMAIENNDHEMAMAWWEKAIDLGHLLSMRSLATLLLHQQQSKDVSSPVQLDLDRALQLLTDASRLGDLESLVLLGQIHQAGIVSVHHQQTLLSSSPSVVDTPQSSASSTSSQHQSIRNSDGEEEFILDDQETQLVEQQQEEQELAIRCFEQAASMGHVGAMFLAGQYWHTQQQYAAAYDFYDQASQQGGHALSKVMRARYRLAGLGGIPIDKKEGFKELLYCAEKENCIEAYNSLGQCYELGLGTEKNIKQAYQWYHLSVETTNDAEAMYRIGYMYYSNQLPVDADNLSHQQQHETKDEIAYRWFHLANTTNGHIKANYYLGLYHKNGVMRESKMIIQKDSQLAIQYLQKSALQGDVESMYQLGLFYLTNENEDEDKDEDNKEKYAFTMEQQLEGIQWLTRSSQLGSSHAQRELGILYHCGRDFIDPTTSEIIVLLGQDFEKAYELFCQASRHGDVTSTVYIGTYFEHGIHVAPSIELAKEWYQDAIDYHHDHSANNNSNMVWLAELGLARLWHQEQASQEAYQLFCNAYEHAKSTLSPLDHETSKALLHCQMMILKYQLYGWGGVLKQCQQAAQQMLLLAQTSHHIKAYLDVAQCYENGIGFPQDYLHAFTWYGRIVGIMNHHHQLQQEKSFNDDDDSFLDEDDDDELDYALALYKLAEFYRLGYTPNGLCDLEKAMNLYQLAADKGSDDAKQYLHSLL
ncbi:hypothetical protein BJ944DRAFT_262915 [Cunninghamella echinulata]|nr:hypothetical protein BJ944DRAFT_262915 [Cunninghamella echinulata]